MRRVTNVDPMRGRKKQVWFEDSAQEREDPCGGPSRYGPKRQVVCNCTSVEFADAVVAAWNAAYRYSPSS
jgi:hypothetical protein